MSESENEKGQAIPRARVSALIAESTRRFEEHGYGLWALRLRAETELVGCGGYWAFHEPPQLELVLSLAPQWWGRGPAAEAGAAEGLDTVFFVRRPARPQRRS